MGTLPTMSDGTVPTLSYDGVAVSPYGDVYVTASDHVNNSALYRVSEGDDGRLGIWLVGDAKTASKAANNWLPGETAEKFHNVLWHDGKVYVATTDYSPVDGEFDDRRGFHWYAYDEKSETFTDLSASEPDGVGAKQKWIMGTDIDPDRGLIYGIGAPTGELFSYNINTGEHNNLGRPPSWTEDYLPVRDIWLDSEGRVYLTAGWQSHSDPYNHVHFYDPDTGTFGENPEWKLANNVSFNGADYYPELQKAIMYDPRGGIYEFDDANDSLQHLGNVGIDENSRVWTLHVDTEHNLAYALSAPKAYLDGDDAVFEFDLSTGESRKLLDFASLDPELDYSWLTSNNAWDDQGRFWVVARPVGNPDHENSRIVAIDIEQVKDALDIGDLSGDDGSLF